MKKTPMKADAERLAKHYGCDAVVIIACDVPADGGDPESVGASWGNDKRIQGAVDSVLTEMLDDLRDVGSEPPEPVEPDHPF